VLVAVEDKFNACKDRPITQTDGERVILGGNPSLFLDEGSKIKFNWHRKSPLGANNNNNNNNNNTSTPHYYRPPQFESDVVSMFCISNYTQKLIDMVSSNNNSSSSNDESVEEFSAVETPFLQILSMESQKLTNVRFYAKYYLFAQHNISFIIIDDKGMQQITTNWTVP